MMGPGMMGSGGFGTFGLVGMILNLVITAAFIVGIVWLVIWLVRRTGANGNAVFNAASGVRQSPREIVGARYTRGEITHEEYQQILADLN
jgi:uncharacterized membrane protein